MEQKLKSLAEKTKIREESLKQEYQKFVNCAKKHEENMKIFEVKELDEQKILSSSGLLCQDWQSEYSELDSKRKQELEVIRQIIELNEKFWGSYDKTSVDRADFYKEEWDNYSNAYVYKSQYGYQHDQTDFKEDVYKS